MACSETTEDTTPGDTSPTQEDTTRDETSPVEETTPVDTIPTEGTTSGDTSPVDETTPGDTSTAQEDTTPTETTYSPDETTRTPEDTTTASDDTTTMPVDDTTIPEETTGTEQTTEDTNSTTTSSEFPPCGSCDCPYQDSTGTRTSKGVKGDCSCLPVVEQKIDGRDTNSSCCIGLTKDPTNWWPRLCNNVEMKRENAASFPCGNNVHKGCGQCGALESFPLTETTQSCCCHRTPNSTQTLKLVE